MPGKQGDGGSLEVAYWIWMPKVNADNWVPGVCDNRRWGLSRGLDTVDDRDFILWVGKAVRSF